MRRLFKNNAPLLAVIIVFAGCSPGSPDTGENSAAGPVYRHYDSYRQIPGVTAEEISAVEALLAGRDSFSYGMTFSTEAFFIAAAEGAGDGGVGDGAFGDGGGEDAWGGFAVLFCRWLSDLFGLRFEPRIYRWDELLESFDAGEIDFSGDMGMAENIGRPYFTSGELSPRIMKTLRLRDRPEREAPCYGILTGTGFESLLTPYLREGSEIITLGNYGEAYRLLKSGVIDIYFDDESAEAFFEQYDDVVIETFFPLHYSPASFSTANPALAPLISVVRKYLEQGASARMVELRRQGREDYTRWKLDRRLTDDEKQYIKRHKYPAPPVRAALEPFNYPASIYNERESRWEGIFPDILRAVGELTGIRFELAAAPLAAGEAPEALLRASRVDLIAVPFTARERNDSFIWVEAPYVQNYYALLSKSDYPDVDTVGIVSRRVGLIVPSLFTDVFQYWFPGHRNTKTYAALPEGFDALERDEIDLLMASQNDLIMMINYYQRMEFKINYYFDQSYDCHFGFNRDDAPLASIIDKAQALIDTGRLNNYWSRRIFDYRAKLAQIRLPYLVSAGVLVALALTLLVILLARSRKQAARLEELVFRRTSDLEVQTELAQAANLAKTRFLANMSHEIRTPMNAIIGMSELMRTDNLDEVQLNYFEDIRKMARALLQIINDILDISKIEAGKMEIVPVNCNIAGLYDNICSFSAFSAKTKDLEFRHYFDSNIPAVIYADEGRVRQIILNIVNNAIKYTREGYVSLRMERLERGGADWLLIVVEDSGVGIKKEDYFKVFEVFRQLDREKNSGVVGTGLGLSITKTLVEMMGGAISFESEYGKGTVFTVRLPLVSGDPAKIEQVGALGRVMAKDGVRVLVVDDNSINLNVASGFLATHAVKAETVTGGRAAIEKLRERRYDLVFMDHMMPEMDGIETTRAIRQMDDPWLKTMPIVALSANAMSGAREAFLAAGMNDFIAKPIDARELNAALVKWLPPDKITAAVDVQKTYRYTGAEPAGDHPEMAELTAALSAELKARLFADFARIEGFDPAAGLSHTGDNAGAYIDILRQFCAEYDTYEADLRSCLAAEDWKNYSVKIHAMKGVLAVIGMDSLSQWAYRLELASKGGEYDACKNETANISEAMRAFRDRLAQSPLMAREKAGPKTRVDSGLVKQKLARLRDACSQGDSDSADALAAELAGMSLDPETDRALEEICSLTGNLDYDAVVKQIDALR
jgi:signal transduction histidine kinase/DNA-binding NarL/FixJ family response regulator/HPt (histidine-containing phosphotransfer) domain-containing protein